MHDCMPFGQYQNHGIITKSETTSNDPHTYICRQISEKCHFLFESRLCCIMKNIFWIVFLFLSLSSMCTASIWIKNVKSYGPTAAQNGVKCLSLMSQFYFKEKSPPRSRTMVVSYTRNLSIPAENIQRLYLKWVHEAIISNEMDE